MLKTELKNLQGGKEKEDVEEMPTYYENYLQAAQHARAGDMILFEWGKGYYITRPYERLKNWGWK